MDVIQRNFFRLLRSGAFGGDGEKVEPMSPWKWNRLYNVSLMHGVAALVCDGIKRHASDFFMQMPEAQWRKWELATKTAEARNEEAMARVSELFAILNKEQLRPILLYGVGEAMLYDNPLHRTCGDIDIFFPYKPQARKAAEWARRNGKDAATTDKNTLGYDWNGVVVEHYSTAQRLTYYFGNRKLQAIIAGETRCCDSEYVHIGGTKVEILPPTINLLLTIVRIARYIINEGISLKQVVDLGMFLRKAGDKVDFVKLQEWIGRLHLGRIAEVEGRLLTDLFGFDDDEIPFKENKYGLGINKVVDDIFLISGNHSDDWYFTQGKNIFVRTSNTDAMTWQVKHLARFFNYYPIETITSFFSSFAHSLTHIEE